MLLSPQIVAARPIALGDPYFSSVVFLAHFDGADAATSTIDSSAYGRIITANGDVQLDTAQQKFGASSSLHDGTGDYWSCAAVPEFNMQAAGDWTVELWFRANSLPASTNTLLHFRVPGSNVGLHMHVTSAGVITVDNGNVASNLAAGSVSTGTWYALAVVRSSTTVNLFLDGSQIDTDTAQDYGNVDCLLQIGRYSAGGVTNDWNGWIDEIRVTKGVARYS